MASADSLIVPEAPDLADVPLPRPATGPTAAVRERLAACARDADVSGEPDRRALALLRESGLLGLALPYEYGGTGADALGLNTAVEQVARVNASASIMLFQHYAVSTRILEHGSPALRRRLLPRLARGEWLAASAWSETGAGANKKHLSTTARRTPDGGWVLDGAKSFTTSAGLADIYLVLAQTEEPLPDAAPDTGYGSAGQTFFLIPADTPGLEPDTSMRLTGMRGSATGFVSVHDCHVPDTARLGPVGAAASIIAGVRDSGATLGAVAVGLAQAALDLAHEHAERRGLTAQQAVATAWWTSRARSRRRGRSWSAPAAGRLRTPGSRPCTPSSSRRRPPSASSTRWNGCWVRPAMSPRTRSTATAATRAPSP